MPKATSKSRTARKHEPSAKQHDNVGKTATASSFSQWRASKIGSAVTITKTNALAQYHLKAADLEGIPFRTQESSTVINGEVRIMHLYKERDIERRAWEKCGGPEAFDEHLGKLRGRHLEKKGANAYFPQPKSYEDSGGGVYIVRRKGGPSSPPTDIFVGKSTTLSDIKDKMASWLWKAFNMALLDIDGAEIVARGPDSGFFVKDADRERPMSAALAMAATYPTRPDQKLESSESVDRVRAVLADAATAPEISPGWEDEDILGELLAECEWSDDFLERLFTALIQLIDEHGLGSEGLEGIRWEVYDKYVQCMRQGQKYDRLEGTWRDWAAEWLDGQFITVGIQWDTSCRGKCPAGRQFNDILPRRHSSGVRLVGW